MAAPDLLRAWDEVIALWQRGDLVPVVHDRVELSEAGHVIELLERGAPFGKVVLLPR